MSNQPQLGKASEQEITDIPSTDSQSKDTQSSEVGWLVSGLLILVLGIGGVLMFSQEKDLQVVSVTPIGSDQLSEAFPPPAMASQAAPTELPPDPSVLPVSLAQDIPGQDGETPLEDIEEKVVYFDFDQAVLSDEAKKLLTPKTHHKLNATQTILIRGHSDLKGSVGYNKALSLRRAKAVKEYLVSLGHAEEAIHVEGFGKAQPVCPESTNACAAQNRRANLFFKKPNSGHDRSQPMVSQINTRSDQEFLTSSNNSAEAVEPKANTKVETVQLTESAEEILPTDPIASIPKP